MPDQFTEHLARRVERIEGRMALPLGFVILFLCLSVMVLFVSTLWHENAHQQEVLEAIAEHFPEDDDLQRLMGGER